MFKKPLADLKTSAPLRNSDRKKLRQKVITEFGINVEDGQDEGVGDLLVPEGLQSVKFTAHAGELGLAYLSADGDPLWFTVGKGSSDLVPTIYTLWKRPNLLPTLSTPSQVIPVLMGGADLMAPGVVTHSTSLRTSQLVSIGQYDSTRRRGGMPLAVGRMAVDASALTQRDRKGKAAVLLHIYKDFLWEMGKGGEIPELPEDERTGAEEVVDDEDGEEDGCVVTPPPVSDVEDEGAKKDAGEGTSEIKEDEDAGPLPLKPEDVSSLLRTSLLQAIRTTLASLPQSSFPLPSSTFYTAHLLPARPSRLLPPLPPHTSTPIDIKHSTHKSLTHFLRSAEKEGLLSLKDAKQEVLVTSVNVEHDAVKAHVVFKTVGEQDAKKAKREAREEKEKEDKMKGERGLKVVELWRPHAGPARKIFEETDNDTSALYTLSDVKTALNAYITTKSLVNAHNQLFVNVAVDELLTGIFTSKGADAPPEFAKREDLISKLSSKMQPWYRLDTKDSEGKPKKGELKPISILVKMRQGRKACTLVTNFEPFLLVAESLADELRKLCASSTAVAPLPGKTAGLEVMVQGKQIKAVSELLIEKGIPKKWIESEDQTEKKKK
ncbi:hypothetical protein SCHPADRAFT_823044 [Schizopora paradoxa]|uniref:SUI1 domain-containing protein n=1 Tax=Schizopora paradoxa TaxID=27342 RepID=A0A0H2RY74_9AGAM|nr:hypothetical protein SCHPADRAFT_823044 [Schizopora paradoxa]